MKTLQIDIISDVVCPWCAIGFHRLQKALDADRGRLLLRWRPNPIAAIMSQPSAWRHPDATAPGGRESALLGWDMLSFQHMPKGIVQKDVV